MRGSWHACKISFHPPLVRVQTGRERDNLYIAHVTSAKTDKAKGAWKAAGPVIPELDLALAGYSYDIVEIQAESAAAGLVQFVKDEAIDILIVSMGRSKSRLNPIQSRTTDYIASHSPCATLVIHPEVCLGAPSCFSCIVVSLCASWPLHARRISRGVRGLGGHRATGKR